MNAHEKKWRVYDIARRILEQERAGLPVDHHHREWADWIVRFNAPQQPREEGKA